MALKEFQIIASIEDVIATGDIIKFRVPFSGTLKKVELWTNSANTNGDNIFNINVNGTDLFSGGSRPKITQNQTHGELTGLSNSLTAGHEVILQLESIATGGVKADLVLQLTIDDGITINSEINSASSKSTPVDADLVGIVDSADSNSLKKLSWANIKATLKAYFDAIYGVVAQNSQSTAYTLVLSDSGKQILHPSSDNNARTFTIPANSSVAYPVGTAITFINKINTVTIAINSDTLTFAGVGTTGSRTLAANSIATAIKISSTEWIISGVGLT